MARPSRNIDQALIAAGLELLPQTGCAGLSARRLAAHAGVNLGMLHYHFGSKENFIAELLGRIYEEMFGALVIEAGAGASPRENLRGALRVLGRFVHGHRLLLARILVDALAGERLAAGFIATNIPRHVAVLARLLRAAQRRGELVRMPVPQALAFIAGAAVAPVLLSTALADALAHAQAGARTETRMGARAGADAGASARALHARTAARAAAGTSPARAPARKAGAASLAPAVAALPPGLAALLETRVASVRALDRRIDLALRGLAPENQS